jgi:hypothetical protein
MAKAVDVACKIYAHRDVDAVAVGAYQIPEAGNGDDAA